MWRGLLTGLTARSQAVRWQCPLPSFWRERSLPCCWLLTRVPSDTERGGFALEVLSRGRAGLIVCCFLQALWEVVGNVSGDVRLDSDSTAQARGLPWPTLRLVQSLTSSR